ncbi:MAG: hydrogenase maturation protease [Chlorobi bacterium]|nr:hydrogenase maturation protease [Chlorobiota bacterium]
MKAIRKTLILGLGNILMKDEGVGVRVVERIDKSKLPDNVDVIDGGTGGFHLLHLFSDYEKFVLIDATLTKDKVGNVRVIKPKFASDFPNSLTSHDIGLRDLMQSAELLGDLPDIDLIVVDIMDCQTVNMELSEEVEKSIPEVHKKIFELIGV